MPTYVILPINIKTYNNVYYYEKDFTAFSRFIFYEITLDHFS